jgi:hypothetical protein
LLTGDPSVALVRSRLAVELNLITQLASVDVTNDPGSTPLGAAPINVGSALDNQTLWNCSI